MTNLIHRNSARVRFNLFLSAGVVILAVVATAAASVAIILTREVHVMADTPDSEIATLVDDQGRPLAAGSAKTMLTLTALPTMGAFADYTSYEKVVLFGNDGTSHGFRISVS